MSSCYLSNGLGDSLDDPTEEQMRAFLAAIDWTDVEHGAAWLTDEDENSLEINAGGRLVFSVGEDSPVHLLDCDHDKVVKLWKKLASGDLNSIRSEAWQPGLCPPEMAERFRKEAEESRRQLDRQFYLSLGAESKAELCTEANCKRGRVSLSVSCRVHHFESVMRRPCPFED